MWVLFPIGVTCSPMAFCRLSDGIRGTGATSRRCPHLGYLGVLDESMVEFFTADDVDDLADHIRALYRDRARLAELSRNIQKFNQRYSWAQQRVEWINLARRLARTLAQYFTFLSGAFV